MLNIFLLQLILIYKNDVDRYPMICTSLYTAFNSILRTSLTSDEIEKRNELSPLTAGEIIKNN